ncbi:MAG TPA: peptide ligase PGM1-related protein, partial [Anaerolineales bacterium]|nr:peptide ligase PGM1-related protein [Anaerolineales bacterium]
QNHNDPQHEEMLAKFERLQEKLIPLWEQIGRTDPGSQDIEDPNTVVVLPSITTYEDMPFPIQQGYEERMLFMLFLLGQPRIRLIYLTSIPIPTEVIDYYLGILPSVAINNARSRLFLVSPDDASGKPLVNKILERPRLVERIRGLIPDMNKVHLVPFLTTDLEREFAVRLEIPMYAADPRFYGFGTKSGCRQIFAEEGLPHPLGHENIFSAEELGAAIRAMRREKPGMAKVIVKLNEGVSGYGNAQLDLAGLPEPGTDGEAAAVFQRLRSMQYELAGVTYEWYIEQIEKKGGIVEELIQGEDLISPSAQLRVTPLGVVELLSTHDQMLGGPTGQIYLGARFPANRAYGPMIAREAEKVGRRLAAEGVVGRFAIDFIVVKNKAGEWDPYAIEINLRKGGTTHPFLTLQYLTDGKYEPETGYFHTAIGQEKYYVATDVLKSEAYHVFTPADLFDLVSNHRLHYNHTSQTGIVMHMISPIGTVGKVGLTAIGDSTEHAEELYQRFIRLLNEKAGSLR